MRLFNSNEWREPLIKTILFVCSGNTCRSPMAACLLNALCLKLGRSDLTAVSAGLSAMSNAPASEGAERAMAHRGLSLRGHRSRPVSERLLRDVSLAICMSEQSAENLRRRYPQVNVPVIAFAPSIPDPYGDNDEAYERVADEIDRQLPAFIRQL